MKIYKYILNAEVNKIKMPKDSIVLSVHEQGIDICIWVLFDERNEKILKERTFLMVVTGSEYKGYNLSKNNYIGTVLVDLGHYVLHVFEMSVANMPKTLE